MKSAETLLACCVVGLACFIGGQAMGSRDDAPHRGATQHEAEGAIDVRTSRTTPRFAPHLAPVSKALAHGEELLVSAPLLLPAERLKMAPEDVRAVCNWAWTAPICPTSCWRVIRPSRDGPTARRVRCVCSFAKANGWTPEPRLPAGGA